ncbi:MAG: diguanylate cyclase, partial [Oscillospiraceae bacterium]
NLPTSNLGYWCKTKDFTNKKDFTNENINILTYTLPIFDAQRDFVGAVGIDIDLDTIYGMIPYKEITSTLRGAYVLGIYDEKKLQINDIFSYGPTFNGMINQKHALNLTNDNFYRTLIRQPKSGVASPVIINCYNLNLYGENSPYKNEVWTLAGIVEETIVTANARQLSLTMLFAVLIAFAISVVGIFVTSFWFNRPIATLMQCLRSYNPDKDKLKLPTFNITELDQLSNTISTLNSDVTHAASRLSQILALSNVPLGAIEYNPKTDMIFCTEAISYLMNFPEDKRENTRFCSREFKILADNFMLHTRPYRNFDTETPKPGCVTLQYTDEHGQSMWIQFHTMMRGSKKITVVQDISENIREKIKLEYERDYDSLTNLRNRRSFKKIVVDILKEKDLGIGAMIMWDMDNLKYINDHYGHDTGDRYLSDAAKMFSTLNSNRGVVARMSGDEFYAFLYNFQTKEELFATVERLHNRMKQTPFVPPDGQAINIRASGGIAWLPEDSEDYDDLVKYADFAMYNVKNTCRGELMDFDREIFNRDEVLISGREALNRFIENRMFKYAFQPIVDLQSGEVFAYEALMRPDCPELPTIHEVMRLATSQSRLYQIEQLTMFGV